MLSCLNIYKLYILYMLCIFNTTIHLFIIIWDWVAVAAGWVRTPIRPFPWPLPRAHPGESWGVSRPAERYNPWVCLGSLPRWTCRNTSTRRCQVDISTKCPDPLNWLLSTWSSSGTIPSFSQMSKLRTLSLRVSPGPLHSFQPLLPVISFYWSLPKAHDYRWGLEHRLTGESRAKPKGEGLWCNDCITATPVMLQLTITREQAPEVLELILELELREATHSLFGVGNPLWLKTMVSGLEVLTLIPTASNLPNKHWKSQPDEAILHTSSVKTSDATLRLMIHGATFWAILPGSFLWDMLLGHFPIENG